MCRVYNKNGGVKLKKKARKLTLISIVIILLIFTACSNNENQVDVAEDKIKEVEDKIKFEYNDDVEVHGNIKFTVNPKIESTYMAVKMLEKETGFTNYRISGGYIGAGQEWLKDYKTHEFIKLLEDMIKNNYQYDAIPTTLHYFDDNFELRNDIEFDEFNVSRAGGMDKLQRLVSHLKDFMEDSDLKSFFNKYEDFYIERMQKGQERVHDKEVEKIINGFYGHPIDEALVTVTPLSMNAYGSSVLRKDGILEVKPTMDVFDNEKLFVSILIHEISHTYVNPLTAENIDKVNKTDALFEPIRDIMARQAYPIWEYAVNEHIVRANTALMMGQIYGESECESELSKNRNEGFMYIDDIAKSIVYYSQNRDKYPEFEGYYLEIIKLLEDLNGDS